MFGFVLTLFSPGDLSVTCFKAIGGADSLADSGAHILDALGDDRLSDIDMEPLDTSDLVSYQDMMRDVDMAHGAMVNCPVWTK